MEREEAIFYIKELQKTYASMDKKVGEAVDMAIEALSSEAVHGWIPCSERLPEENVVVLTQAKFKDDIKMAVSARQDYNYWTGWGTREVNIVAWMPLPEPYREDGEE